jgi:predicted outer membrane repeat protein
MNAKSLLLFFVLSLFLLKLSFADQWRVTNSQDGEMGSLRAIVTDAQVGDSIYFDVRGTLGLTQTLQINQSLYFFGPGVDSLLISGGDSVRIMRVDTMVDAYFEHLTFAHGNAILDSTDLFSDGGVVRNLGTFRAFHCVFRDNQAGFGGAIMNSGLEGRNAQAFLENCSFINNSAVPPVENYLGAPRAGGAIFSDGRAGGRSKIFARNCTFSGNRSLTRGGAILVLQDQGDTTRSLVCVHCTITDNEANGSGGIDMDRYGLTRFRNTIIAGNRGRRDNPNVFGNLTSLGGLLVGKITLNSSIGANLMPDDLLNADPMLGPLGKNGNNLPTHGLLCNSPARDAGVSSSLATDQRGRPRDANPDIGAVERDDDFDTAVTNKQDTGLGSLRFSLLNACPSDTLDASGLLGTIWVKEEMLIDKSVHIQGNPVQGLWLRAEGNNRIMVVDTGISVSVQHLSFANGKPETFGGGAILNKGTLAVESCTFHDNWAIAGGAIGNYGDGGIARLSLLNSTFSGNQATQLDGGAIDNFSITDSAFLEINHCTFANNRAKKRGGAIFHYQDGEVLVRNSLFGNNLAEEGNEVAGRIQSGGHNLLQSPPGPTFMSQTSDLSGMDPMIGNLQPHGGPTYTHQLLAGSPAIDAAASTDPPAFDQRGYPRIFNGIPDMGAYEYDPATHISFEDAPESLWKLGTNSSQGLWLLSSTSDWSEKLHISVIDMNGKTCWNRTLYGLKAGEKLALRLHDQAKGLYVLRIQGKMELFSLKLMK